jgi:hypothetical protein
VSAPTVAPPAAPDVDRLLPGPTDEAWLDPQTVADIAFYRDRMDRASETTWREIAERSVDWGWPS